MTSGMPIPLFSLFPISNFFRTHQNLMWMENGRETRAYIFQNIRNYLIEKVPKIRERCQPVNIPQPGRLRHIINQR